MIIDALKELQTEQNLTDSEIAQKLGIHRATWQRTKNHHQEPSSNFLIAVMRVFPELREAVDIFLSSSATNPNTVAGFDAIPPETHQNGFLACLTRITGKAAGLARKFRA